MLLRLLGQEVLRFHKLAQSFLRTIFIWGIPAGGEDAVRSAIEVAARHENAYLDTACSHVWYGAVEVMAQARRLQGAVLGRLLELYGGRSGPHFVG